MPSSEPRNALVEASGELRACFEHAVKQLEDSSRQDGAPSWPMILISGIPEFSSGLADGTLALFKAMLENSDSAAQKLANEPLATGVRVVRQALQMPVATHEEWRRQQERLKFAIEKLETAWTLLGDTLSPAELLNLNVVHGTCALAMEGGHTEARRQFTQAADRIDIEIQQTLAEAGIYEIAAESALALAGQLSSQLPPQPAFGDRPSTWIRRDHSSEPVDIREGKIRDHQHEADRTRTKAIALRAYARQRKQLADQLRAIATLSL